MTKESAKELQNKYSEENIKKKLIFLIEKKYGKDHKIKLVIFKANCEYDDEYNNYEPILILVDENHNELDHNISLWDVTPDQDEQYTCYEFLGEDIYVKDLTFKF